MLPFCNRLHFHVLICMAYSLSWFPVFLLFSGLVVLPGCLAALIVRRSGAGLRTALWSQVGCMVAFLSCCWVLSHNQVHITHDSLTLQAGPYQTAVSSLSAADTQVSVVSAQQLGEFQPASVVNGILLPEYQVGWFRLANDQLAFVMFIGEVAEVSIVKTANTIALISGNVHQATVAQVEP